MIKHGRGSVWAEALPGAWGPQKPKMPKNALCSPQNALAPHQMVFPPQASQIVTIGACATPPRLHDTVLKHSF